MSEVHFDYGFLGKEGEPGKLLPVLVAKERITGMILASAVPSKTTGTFITNRIMAFLKEIGCEFGDLLAKFDQEPAIKGLVKGIVDERAEGRRVVEESPVGSSASNGIVERAVQELEGQSRVLLSSLQDRLGKRIDGRE